MAARKFMSPISELPEGIIHQILSLLEAKDAAMASLMCKSWWSAWLTKPNLLIRDDIFNLEKRAIYAKTLLRYQQQKIGIDRLEIVFDDSHTILDDSLDSWLKLAVANGVEKVKCFPCPYVYSLHPIVFQAKSLVDLQVRNCYLKLLGVEKTMCHNLKNLWIYRCLLNPQVLEKILSSCRLIDRVYVWACSGFNQLKVSNPPKLKRLELSFFQRCSVEVESLSLEHFYWKHLSGCHLARLAASNPTRLKDKNKASGLTLHACPNLKSLKIEGILITDAFFSNFACKFPQLELLVIFLCFLPKRIKISSHSVKKIRLVGNLELKEIEINAPSLDYLEFWGNIVPQFIFTTVSNDFISEINKRK